MKSPIWTFKAVDDALVKQVAEEFNLPDVIARVMAQRGITDRSASRRFFFPDDLQIHDPFLMKDMDKAVDRILEAVKNRETLLVFGDYDVDGTTGTAMFYLFIRSLGGDIQYYIPDREQEGYGLSRKGVDYAQAIGASLIISCDCGINAFEVIKYANELGLQVIITDHHQPEEQLPDAFAVLNPKREDCSYPFKGLCGAGVIFKLSLGIATKGGTNQEDVWQHSDLISMGIAADIVPVVDENRVIVQRGIELIQSGRNTGINALVKAAGLANKEITVGRLVFWMAPKINAAGRMGDAGRAVKLLTTSNPMLAKDIAQDLELENRRRQDLTAAIVEDAIHLVNSSGGAEDDPAIVLAQYNWHPGVIGIVAARIKELFFRPTIIIAVDKNGLGKGSGRSIPGFDLYDALNACKEPLEGFGGHPVAAGLSIMESEISHFREAFLNYAKETITTEMLQPILHLDGELPLSGIDARMLKFLKAMSPYGPGNMRPRFVARNIHVEGIPKLVGRDSNVLKMSARENKTIFDAVGFDMTDHYEKLLMNKPIDIVYEIGENEWNGRVSIQLELKDIKIGGEDYA